MSIETLLQTLIASIDANTAALTGGKASSTKTSEPEEKAAAKTTTKAGAKTTTTKTTTKKSAVTREDVNAAFHKVKEEHGTNEAKALLAEIGVAKLADLDEDQFEEALKLAQAKLEGGDDGVDDI